MIDQTERMRRAAAALGIEIPQAGITTEELLTRILEVLADDRPKRD